MNRREMIDELLERIESELDELNNSQLSTLISDYEHSPLLVNIIELPNVDDDDEEEDDDVAEDEELLLIDDVNEPDED